MNKAFFLITLLSLLSCKNVSDNNNLDSSKRIKSSSDLQSLMSEKETPYSVKKIDSILKIGEDNFPILIYRENNFEAKIFSYGKIGEYAGLYSEVELASKVYYLKTFKNNKIIDSLEIYKEEIGEGVFRSKKISFLADKEFEISISESWEDAQTEKESIIDSSYIYNIKENGKIEMLSKQETKRIIH